MPSPRNLAADAAMECEGGSPANWCRFSAGGAPASAECGDRHTTARASTFAHEPATARCVVEQWGRTDLLFNSAGVFGLPAPLDEVALEQWRLVVDTSRKRSAIASACVSRISP